MPLTRPNKISISVAILIVLLATLVSGHIFLKNKFGYATVSQQIGYLLGQKISTEQEKNNDDADRDGLKDWEETIYHTDQKNPDTDGDGYLDGEEVATGYNPLKKAPDDLLIQENAGQPRPLPKNLTTALGAKLGEAIAEGKIKSFNQQGQPLNTQELLEQPGLDQIINDAVGQQINDFLLPEISDSEIKISDQTGRQATIDYLDAASAAIGQISSEGATEMDSFNNAVDNNDFSQLETNQKTYAEGYQKLKKVAVPRDLISFHKGMLGALWVTNNIYSAIKNINQDPLKSTIALSQYPKIDQKTNELIVQLINQITSYQ